MPEKLVLLVVHLTGVEPALLSEIEPNGSNTTVDFKYRLFISYIEERFFVFPQ